ncbi:PREDICTED: mitogen-activated protein kinase kinase kinase 2-like [Tarenaya hassleriana]|uniref:mitogen-activated protein kinase kinase kinase 2-like n=1 Tax=Tarenaya hassleriana TaxID=28532 RepID=UPI00053C79F0|nr:PREDICTED: mitogen-activated protein kinase kinase kinase 2-like [Tarenaya hassleriana]
MKWVRGETVGYGSFATVSLATPANKYSGEFPPLMAVKSAEKYGAASLANEKSVLDQLGHCREIVRCFGDDRTVENGEEIYNLLLEYASRGSLATHVKKSDGLPESAVRRHTESVLRGLRHIHASGFAHCDIKLGNILMFGNGAVKIADFGLAKRIKVVDGEETASEGTKIRGTPLYMAPESVNDNEYGSEADVWALGCAVVEMFSGKTAWSFKENSNFMSLLMRIGVGDETPRVPEELSEVGRDFLSKCFVKDPKKRWTAEMLLCHPFVAVDLGHDDDDDHQLDEEFAVETKKEEVSASPKGPFDFPDWDSESLDSQTRSQPLDWPEERIGSLATDFIPDWSVTGNWVTVR